MKPDQLLLAMFEAAVAAAHPSRCVPPHLPAPPKGRTVVIGAGKAAAAMAQAVEAHWHGSLTGLVITRYGHGATCNRVEVIEAGHPVPDAAGQAGAERMLQLLQGLSADDLVLCLISGGGSSLLSLAPESVPLEDKRRITKALLKSGAAIHEINCVRKHLSRIKGGRLALAAAPARVITLMISDVPGDDPSIIASGPTVADPSTRFDALAVLEKYHIDTPASVIQWLNNPESETPKPGDPRLQQVQNILVATPAASLQAAAEVARSAGIMPIVLGDALEGEARDCGVMHAQLAKQCLKEQQPAKPPCVIISGGETTVTVHGKGRGGRNAEFLLSLGLALDAQADTWAIACDTDGIDGTESNAGALIGPRFLQQATSLGLQPSEFLHNNDAFSLFEHMDCLIKTGPTRTNVNDFRAIFIGRRA
ncbi:MAG: glycerate kinase [Steroidobacteraceae bacterium]